MAFIVPPGGFRGFAQMTSASQAALGGRPGSSATRRAGGRKRKAKATKKRASGKRATRKLKFGSPAWRKKYMK